MKNFNPPQNQNKEREENRRKTTTLKNERRKKRDGNTKKGVKGRRERRVINWCGEIESGKEGEPKKRRLGAKRPRSLWKLNTLKRRRRERIIKSYKKMRKKRNSKKRRKGNEKRKNKPSSSLQNDFQNSIEFFSKSEIIIVPNESTTIPEGSFM